MALLLSCLLYEEIALVFDRLNAVVFARISFCLSTLLLNLDKNLSYSITMLIREQILHEMEATRLQMGVGAHAEKVYLHSSASLAYTHMQTHPISSLNIRCMQVVSKNL